MIFNTEKEAKDYSHKEALIRGCKGVTQYWWGWIKHPVKDLWAVNEKSLTKDWYENELL